RALPALAPRGHRRARGRDDGTSRVRGRRGRPLPELRANGAAPVRRGSDLLRAGKNVRTRMSKPVIGITTYLTPARFGDWDEEAALIPASYVRAIEAAGGRPLLVPPSTDAIEETLDRLDGILFSGGSDLDPELYGQAAHAKTNGIVPDRDRGEIALLKAAL